MGIKESEVDKKNAPPKTFWDECDYMILWSKSASRSSLNWDSSRAIALILNKKFPNTDVLGLDDDNLLGMMKEAGILAGLPEIDDREREDCLLSIKVALARIIENDEGYIVRSNDAES